MTPFQCAQVIIQKTGIPSNVAKELGSRINDSLRYRLVTLRVEKSLNFFTGSNKPTKEQISKFAYDREWSDVARIVDRTFANWRPQNNSETKRTTRQTSQESDIRSPTRGVYMYFCRLTTSFVNITQITEYVRTQDWPFLQVREKVLFNNGCTGRGVITTATILEGEVVCDYHTDKTITRSAMAKQPSTQYVVDCQFAGPG